MSDKLLVVVDMQNDFIDGALKNDDARAIIGNVCQKIKTWDGPIACTMDTHDGDYLSTHEGKMIPVEHCILGTEGWKLNGRVSEALRSVACDPITIQKPTFGTPEIISVINRLNVRDVTFIGICTDIYVISNAIIAASAALNMRVTVDAACCAGITKQSHENALRAMQCLGFNIENFEG